MPHTAGSSRAPLWTRIRPWVELQELPRHLANLLPFLLGTALAYWEAGTIDWRVFGVALLALFLLTDGTHLANEYFDYENDRLNRTRIGGADRVGVKGLIRRRDALFAAIAAFVLAIPLGLILRFGLGTGPLTIPLGALALLLGWFYTAPPIKARYRGLGELFIAVGQGLVVFGAYYVQRGFSFLPLVVSLPWFLALPALKVIREFPDYEADRAAGTRGLAVRFGRERMAVVYDVLVSLAIFTLFPLYAIVHSPTFWIVLFPIFFLARSVMASRQGAWRIPAMAKAAAVDGFIGMLLIPMTLTAAFLGAALLKP